MKIPVAIFASVVIAVTAQAQSRKPLPVLHTNKDTLTMVIGPAVYKNAWTVNPKLNPDVMDIPVPDKPVPVKFISAVDSVSYLVKAGSIFDFIVVHGKDSAYTRIAGKKVTPAAKFSKQYIKSNNQKTLVEIPPVYELVNILISLTDAAKKDRDLAYHNSAYYKKVQEYFAPYRDDKAVQLINREMENGRYHPLKMDGYSFILQGGKIIQSPVYDRVSWGTDNLLRPYIADIQRFSDKTGFPKFYEANRPVYDAQIRCYRDSINTGAMVNWLRNNFPGTDYNAFKIIFSPLVAGNQSANWFESNGFKEAQAHVNFPYVSSGSQRSLSEKALNLSRGGIVFTEINHSFINPEQEKYAGSAMFMQAFSNLHMWLDRTKPAKNYYTMAACFNEYMNWALVSLYYLDNLPPGEALPMVKNVEQNMKNYRGFKKFPEFDQALIRLYQDRGSKTLARLYPDIISWCMENKD